MIILAIDPGPVQSAWLGLRTTTDEVVTFAKVPNDHLLATLRNALGPEVGAVVIEQVESFGMAVGREVFETVYWSGRFAEAARHLPVHRIGRKAVKLPPVRLDARQGPQHPPGADRPLRRLLSVRRTVCGRDCGGWVQREPEDDQPMPCGGYHRNKRLWCEADAKWAITSVALIGQAEVLGKAPPDPFFRCTYCARGYREGWLGEFVVERLMDEPPKALDA